jgi:predicted N-acetyltransferase YhbS
VRPVLRRATAADLPAIAVADGRAFGVQYTPAEIDTLIRPLLDPERFLLACDPADGTILGVTGDFPFALTLPGGTTLPAPGVTWVSVATTHRRRGILRSLLHAQHHGFVERGYPVALLTASEGGIYGRFGYGPATAHSVVRIDRRLTGFRAGVPDPGGVRQVEAAEARRLAPDVHRRWCARTPGALSRSPAWWDHLLADPEYRRRGGSALFHLLHPDGYASYRIHHADASCRGRRPVRGHRRGPPRAVAGAARARPRALGAEPGLPARRPVALPAHRPAAGADHRAPRRDVGQGARRAGGAGRAPVRGRGGPRAGGPRRLPPRARRAVPAPGWARRRHVPGDGRGTGRARRRRRPRVAPARRARVGTLVRAGLLDVADPELLRLFDAACAAERSPRFGTDF